MGRAKGRVQAASTSEKRPDLTVTAGQVFPDSSLLELVRDPSDPARPALLHWDGKHPTVALEIAINGRRYVPPQIDPSVWRCLRLPSGVVPYGSTTELFNAICDLIIQYSGLDPEYAARLTYFVFSSLFPDCLQTAPCLVLHRCAVVEGIALLRQLHWLCRHLLLIDTSW